MHTTHKSLGAGMLAGVLLAATPALGGQMEQTSQTEPLRLSRSAALSAGLNAPALTVRQDAPAPDMEGGAEADGEPEWLSEFDFNIGGSTGNTETLNLRVAFRTTRETEAERLKIDASYFYGEADNVKNQSRATAGFRNDWFLGDSPWTLFAQGRYDFTEFREWKHRASGHGGAGYYFVRSEELDFIGRIGAGASKEWSRTDDLTPEGLLGLEVDWTISDRQRLRAETTLFPELDDFFEFRWVSSVSWMLELDNLRGVSISTGIENEYESTTDEGVDNNDLRYYAGLTVAF